MKIFRAKFFVIIFAILLILVFGYYRKDAVHIFREFQNKIQPCQNPITYSIASIDSRFGLTKEELLNNMEQVEKIWEFPVAKQLFEYSPAGDLKINFIYDYRQKATDALREMGLVINDDQSTYEELKAKYDLLFSSYNKEKARLDALIKNYNTEKNIYDRAVDYWNSRGGAQKTEYKILEQKRIDLNNQVAIINQAEGSLNKLVDNINSLEIVLNKLIATLNLSADKYNTVVASTGKEFNEGEYISDANGMAINIFQFNDNNQLIRVLAHELGHAIGLEHIDNKKAIMYYLNEGINSKF